LLGMLCDAYFWSYQGGSEAAAHAEEVMQLAKPGSIPWAQGALAKIANASQAIRADDLLAVIDQIRRAEPAPDALSVLILACGSAVFMLDTLGYLRESNMAMAVIERLSATIPETQPIAAMWWHQVAATRTSVAKEDPWGAFQHARLCLKYSEEL